jgi:hypothetical protein
MDKKNGSRGSTDLVGRRITHHAPGGKQTGRVTFHQGSRIEYRPDGAAEGAIVMASLENCTVLDPVPVTTVSAMDMLAA